jgi:hypothetical protein
VTKFVHGLFEGALTPQWRVRPEAEPAQRNNGGSAARLRYAKDKVQIAGVEIGLGDRHHPGARVSQSMRRTRRQAEKAIRKILAPMVGTLRKRHRPVRAANEVRCREVDCEVLQVFSRRLAY